MIMIMIMKEQLKQYLIRKCCNRFQGEFEKEDQWKIEECPSQ